MRVGTDTNGRPYLTFKQAKAGRSVRLDGGFHCVRNKGAARQLRKGPSGLWFKCACGTHLLDGQADFDGGQFYVGVYPVRSVPK